MLTINQIIECYGNGVKLVFRKKSCPNDSKGDYDPSTLEANIYLPNIESPEDLEMTIIHELIHARDNVRASRNEARLEKEVERETEMTYTKKPEVIEFIKEIYGARKKIYKK